MGCEEIRLLVLTVEADSSTDAEFAAVMSHLSSCPRCEEWINSEASKGPPLSPEAAAACDARTDAFIDKYCPPDDTPSKE